MKKAYTTEQIAYVLREAEEGTPVAEVCQRRLQDFHAPLTEGADEV